MPSPGQHDGLVLDDVSDFRQLQVYAATAQVLYLDYLRPQGRRWSQTDIAERWYPNRAHGVGTDPGEAATQEPSKLRRQALSLFVRQLKEARQPFLHRLDGVLLDLAPELSRAGALAAFAGRLSGIRRAKDFGFVVPAQYQSEILSLRRPPPIFVLQQAAVLLAKFEQDPDQAKSTYPHVLTPLTDDLIRIGSLPPTPYSVDALLALGGLARFAFGEMKERLELALETPLGFRVWRAIAAVVTAIKESGEEDTFTGRQVRGWVMNQLRQSDRLREYSLYPARSLDLEVAILVPLSWSPPGERSSDWAGNLLRRRAADPAATLRERGTAVFGLWERAVDGGYQDAARAELREIIESFRAEGPARPGLSWVAATLEQNINQGGKILTHWPDLGQPCQQIIADAAAKLDQIPERIREATATLFEQAVIKNAGVYRRRAVDTLRAGGWAAQVVPAMRAVLDHPDVEPWLSCRALFAIGFMQEHNEEVLDTLLEACQRAWLPLRAPGARPSTGQIAEMHAALFAVGDCFGMPDAGRAGDRIRRQLDATLMEITTALENDPEQVLRPVGRALAYLLSTTSHAQGERAREMLMRLNRLPDTATRDMTEWGLARLRSLPRVRPAHEVDFLAPESV
ncbi:MAG: hypothetical protein ABW046_09510 [Actinoplanes sp.]